MILTLFFMIVLLGLSSVFVLRAVNENRIAGIELENTKAFYAAQGGNQAGLNQVDTLINNYLQTTITSANPSGVISNATSKVASGDGIGWLIYAVRNNNVPVLTQNGEQAEYAQSGTLGNINYTYNITLTEKSDPVSAGQDAWDFPYSYRLETTSSSSGITGKVVTKGDFTVRVQRDNFAKFALFTNTQTTQSGTKVWFTDKTNFSGPVHTNDRFNFALNPSGTFDGLATEFQPTARFYNQGNYVLLDANLNGTVDVPTFNAGFNRNVSSITLNSSTQEQNFINQAKANTNTNSNGIYVPHNGPNLKGGVYVKGDGTIDLSVDNSNNAVYTITQGAATKKVTVQRVAQQTVVDDITQGTSQTYAGVPNGVDGVGTIIYVEGSITSLKGTVEKDTQLTISSKNDVVITNHLKYAEYTPAVGTPGTVGYVPPSADGETNLLGLVTWHGNVRIGTAAPNNIAVHGSILAQNGVFQVDSYDNTGVGPRGIATLLGGFISNNYGAFGLFNGSTGQAISGYGRNFVYDQRMLIGNAPPYFPSLTTFVAFTNDITDKLVWQEGQ